jgi:hypothetical protein
VTAVFPGSVEPVPLSPDFVEPMPASTAARITVR